MTHDTTQSFQLNLQSIRDSGTALTQACYGQAAYVGWHTDLKTGQPKPVSVPEKLMLIVSELGEAMEGHRKNLNDDKLPQYPMTAVELADAAIRIFDTAGLLGYDLGEIIALKLQFNATRADHQIAARLAEGGKAY